MCVCECVHVCVHVCVCVCMRVCMCVCNYTKEQRLKHHTLPRSEATEEAILDSTGSYTTELVRLAGYIHTLKAWQTFLAISFSLAVRMTG